VHDGCCWAAHWTSLSQACSCLSSVDSITSRWQAEQPVATVAWFAESFRSSPIAYQPSIFPLAVVQSSKTVLYSVEYVLCLHRLCCSGRIIFLPCPSRCPDVCPGVCPVPSVFLSLCKNTERISMKLAGGSHYHQQIKLLHFGWNWNRDKGAWYDRKFESTSSDVAAMSNRCWRLANEFTNCIRSVILRSDCEQDYCKSNQPIWSEVGVMIWHTNRRNRLTFDGDAHSDTDFG